MQLNLRSISSAVLRWRLLPLRFESLSRSSGTWDYSSWRRTLWRAVSWDSLKKVVPRWLKCGRRGSPWCGPACEVRPIVWKKWGKSSWILGSIWYRCWPLNEATRSLLRPRPAGWDPYWDATLLPLVTSPPRSAEDLSTLFPFRRS